MMSYTQIAAPYTQSSRLMADFSILSCIVTVAAAGFHHMPAHALAMTLKSKPRARRKNEKKNLGGLLSLAIKNKTR